MFLLSSKIQPQVTVRLNHLINAFHSLKGSVVKPNHRTRRTLQELHITEPSWSLRDVGLTDLGVGQLDKLQDRSSKLCRAESHPWRTSYLSTDSFHSKYGFSVTKMGVASPVFCKQSPSALQTMCTDLNLWPALIQRRGFKTLRSKTRGLQSGSQHSQDTDTSATSLMKDDRGPVPDHLDSLLKSKNIPEAHHDAFKMGYREGHADCGVQVFAGILFAIILWLGVLGGMFIFST